MSTRTLSPVLSYTLNVCSFLIYTHISVIVMHVTSARHMWLLWFNVFCACPPLRLFIISRSIHQAFIVLSSETNDLMCVCMTYIRIWINNNKSFFFLVTNLLSWNLMKWVNPSFSYLCLLHLVSVRKNRQQVTFLFKWVKWFHGDSGPSLTLTLA